MAHGLYSAHRPYRAYREAERSVGATNSIRSASAEVIPWHRHVLARAADAGDPTGLEGRRELPVQRWIRGLSESHLLRRPVRVRPLPVRQRASAVLPGQVGGLRDPGHRPASDRRTADPGRTRHQPCRRRVLGRCRRGQRRQVRPDLSGRHADARSSDLAHDGQDRCGPRGPDHTVPRHSGRAVGATGDPATVCTRAAPVSAQDHADDRRATRGPQRPVRQAPRHRDPARGHEPDPGCHYAPARDAPGREGSGDPLRLAHRGRCGDRESPQAAPYQARGSDEWRVFMTRVAVFGTGSWGTAFAAVLADAGSQVRMWGRRAELVDEINQSHVNSGYLPDLLLPESIWATTDPMEAADGVDVVVLAVPSQTLRVNLGQWADFL